MKLILPLLLLFATICHAQTTTVITPTNITGVIIGNGGGLTNLVNADTNGAGTAAAAGLSNLLGSAAYVSTNSFDTNGAAVAVTNGYPWGGLYDTNNAGIAAALAATNGSWLSASNLVVTATNGSWISASNLVFNATNNYVGGVTLGGVSNVVAAYTNVLASTNYVNTATNNFGNSVAVSMTNVINKLMANTLTLTNAMILTNSGHAISIGFENIGGAQFPVIDLTAASSQVAYIMGAGLFLLNTNEDWPVYLYFNGYHGGGVVAGSLDFSPADGNIQANCGFDLYGQNLYTWYELLTSDYIGLDWNTWGTIISSGAEIHLSAPVVATDKNTLDDGSGGASFAGTISGNGSGLTGVPYTAITGGLTMTVTNLKSSVVSQRLYFTNGILAGYTCP